MPEFHDRPDLVPHYVGREREFRWLYDNLMSRDRWFTPLVVHGAPGVGKTTFLRQFLATARMPHQSSWIDVAPLENKDEAIDAFVERMFRTRDDDRRLARRIVVIDGAETMNDQQLERAVGRIFNWKPVRGLVISSRRQLSLERAETLELPPLDLEAAKQLLQAATELDIESYDLERIASAVNGYPLAIQLLASLIKSDTPIDISRLLAGNFYDLADVTSANSSELIVVAKPKIISASEAIATGLKKQPCDVRNLTPRQFEELLAELMTDMGWEVELTKATRDGGKDLLAYMDTEVGRLLCLVEAKRYREDRKIGVDLVRTLYGTLCDYQANSAMMVTTSSFSADAKEFQQRHQYQLSLRDYNDLVRWITQYKANVAG